MTLYSFFQRHGAPEATAFALVAAGFTTRQIQQALADGHLRQDRRGVFWLPSRRPTLEKRTVRVAPVRNDDLGAARLAELRADGGGP